MQNTCEDCIYYVQHYRKAKSSFKRIGCGHCIQEEESGEFRKTDKLCDSFGIRNATNEKQEQQQNAAKSLEHIACLLKDLKEVLLTD